MSALHICSHKMMFLNWRLWCRHWSKLNGDDEITWGRMLPPLHSYSMSLWSFISRSILNGAGEVPGTRYPSRVGERDSGWHTDTSQKILQSTKTRTWYLWLYIRRSSRGLPCRWGVIFFWVCPYSLGFNKKIHNLACFEELPRRKRRSHLR